ncbi:hypothetical protein EDD86DRAFT_101879 [Gorgonomyces haynaldii]|nr:hypothetical protein EDD86DRAFT_101879 [Gorgonomyces haynaldii]
MPLFLKSIKDEDEGLCLGMAKLSSVQPLDASILVDVCSHGLTELCKYLIKRFQLDPSWNGNACLLAACERGHLKTVKLLLKDPRVDPGLHNSLALQRAAFYGHQDVVMFLLRDSRVQPKDAHLVQRMQSMKL